MIKNQSSQEENIMKDLKKLFKLKKELNYTAIKDVRDHLRF